MKKVHLFLSKMLVATLFSSTLMGALPPIVQAVESDTQSTSVEETQGQSSGTKQVESLSTEQSDEIQESSQERVKEADSKTQQVTSLESSEKETQVKAAKKEKETVPVQFLGINDFHGALDSTGSANLASQVRNAGKAAYLAAEFDQAEQSFKAQNEKGYTIRLQAGDLVGASPSNSSLLQDEPTIKVANALKIDYGILGNHEFDEGLAEFNRIYTGQAPKAGEFNEITENYAREASTMTMLSANIFNKGTKEIPFGYKPYEIKEIDGVNIGFIGVVTDDIPNLVLRKHTEAYDFTDPAEAIATNAAILRKQGVNAIVVIGHTGADGTGAQIGGESAAIIDRVNAIDADNSIDVYFAGHSHSYANGIYKNVRVIQGTSQGKAFSNVVGEIDKETNDFVEVPEGEVNPVLNNTSQDKDKNPTPSSLTPNGQINGIVEEANGLIASVVSKEIGETKDGEMITRAVNNDDAQESPLGNFITDGQLAIARQEKFTDVNGKELPIHFALTNNGGIRDDLKVTPDGKITWGAAQAVQPFGNIMQVVSIKGSDLVEALNQQFISYLFLQVAGLRYEFTGAALAGDVKEDTRQIKQVWEVKEDGTEVELDLNGTYNIVINDFLFGGGDGFSAFTKSKLIGALDPDTDIFIDYIESLTKAGKKIEASVENRKQHADEVSEDKTQMTILGTTDVHGNLWDFSYEDNAQANLGLARISGYVNKVRDEKGTENVLLVDNGDIVQGTILTDDLYNVKEDLLKVTHPMIKAMNVMKYDSMVLGNHEFNFGLSLINKLTTEANFPILSANTYVKETDKQLVKPYTIVEKSGVKVAILGLTIPDIPLWDGAKVDSLYFTGLRDEAIKQVKIIEEQEQPDVIVATIHAGLENNKAASSALDVIKNVPEIDAYIVGHDHKTIAEKITDNKGTEKPVGASKDTGSELSKIELELKRVAGKWQVSGSEVVSVNLATDTTIQADEALKEATKEYHQTTLDFISKEIGIATGDFLPEQEIPGIPEAQMRPTALISLINNVQLKETGADVSAAALFKADSQLNKGPITYANIFDIYKYANTLVGVEITGANLKDYMEAHVGYYNQYKPGDLTISFGGETENLNEKIRVYNYDMFSGVDYQIDVSKPIGQRIVQPTIKGQPIEDKKVYKLAVNNYRLGELQDNKWVTEDPYFNTDPATLRGMIVDYIKEKGSISPEEELTSNWEIIGAPDLNHYVKPLVVEKIKAGDIHIEATPNNRTPNINTIRISDLLASGILKESDLADKTFTVLHTNDMHGRMQEAFTDDQLSTIGLARLKTYKNQIAPALMLDAGDAVQGLPISNISEGSEMIKAMNRIGYDAMAVGNHEFDFGYDVAMSYQDKAAFPLLSANVYKDGKRSFEPYTKIEKGGVSFTIIGLTTPETATKTHPNNIKGVTFAEPIEEAKKALKEAIREYGQTDQYIFLAHLGIDQTTPNQWKSTGLVEALSADTELEKLNMMVIDGHSHTEITPEKNTRIPLVQTGEYLNNIGKVKGTIKDGQTSYQMELIHAKELTSLVPNQMVQTIVEAAENNFNEATKEVLVKDNKIKFDGLRDNVRSRETNLGNLLSDGLLSYGQTGFSKTSDFAVINGGGIRKDILPGDITRKNVIEVLPFGNTVTQISLTGKQVYEMFEHSLRAEAQKAENGSIILDENSLPKLGANGGFLHVSSSIRIHYDSTKQGEVPAEAGNSPVEGERVWLVELKNTKTGAFEPIDVSKTYHMATNDFLAAGGDGYTMLGGQREEGPSMDDVIATFLKEEIATGKVSMDEYEQELSMKRIISQIETAVEPEVPGEVVKLELGNLKLALEKADKLVEKDYIAASWQQFVPIKEEAHSIYSQGLAQNEPKKIRSFFTRAVTEELTQTTIDKTTNRLTTAMSELEKNKVTSEPTDDADKPTGSTNGNNGSSNTGNGKGNLPQTGEQTNYLSVMGLIVLGSISIIMFKIHTRIKEDNVA